MNARIKIVEPGWTGYTGSIGPTEFKDGVSIAAIDILTIDRIGANLRIERVVEDGETDNSDAHIGIQHRMIASTCMRLDVVEAMKRQNEVPQDEEPKIPDTEGSTTETVAESNSDLTEVDLQKIADADGIKGLREIGDRLGVKGRAIPDLIEAILAEQDVRRRQKETKLKREGE